MNEFNRLEFIKSQKPRKPFLDWRVWSLFIPAVASAIGFIIFAIIGYSFTEFSAISEKTRIGLVLVGGINLAIGGELGTIFTTIELGRKHKLNDINGWDKSAIVFSLLTTLAGFILGLATLLGEFASWSRPVQVWGSIIVGALAAIDAYFGYWETGYLFADYTKRMKDWFLQMEEETMQMSPADFQSKFADFQAIINGLQNTITDLHKSVIKLQSDVEYLQMPKADLQAFKVALSKANGSLAKYQCMDVLDSVNAVCHDAGLRFDGTLRTAHNWRKEIEK